MKQLTILVLAITLISVFSVYYNAHAAQLGNSSTKKIASTSKPVINDIQSFKEVTSIIDSSHNKLLIFDLYAPWCGPCRKLAPILESLAEQYGSKASFYRVNIDALPDVASAFGVSGIPHVVFVTNKEAISTQVGLHPRSHYEQIIMTYIHNKQKKQSEQVHNN
jgi:thioredoxin